MLEGTPTVHNIFCRVGTPTYKKLCTLAIRVGLNRMIIYALALYWAANQQAFQDYLDTFNQGYNLSDLTTAVSLAAFDKGMDGDL